MKVPLCKNCVYYVRKIDIQTGNVKNCCIHDELPSCNPINGETDKTGFYNDCKELRSYNGICGYEGMMYHSK